MNAYRKVAILMVTLFMVTGFVGCGHRAVNMKEGNNGMAVNSIEQVLRENTPKWMSIDGVVGTAIGELEGTPCIVILVSLRTPDITNNIPSKLDGYQIVIRETGEFRAREEE